jgi:hypothetical protein
MTTDLLFRIANNATLVGWLTLIFLPRWRSGSRLIAAVLIPLFLAALYATLVITRYGHGGGFTSLTGVGILFQNRSMLLAGWVHYLAFDLFVGSWEVRDAQRIGISHYLVVPCLILTFLFGPAGWLLYFFIRTIVLKTIDVGETAEEEAARGAPTNGVPLSV